MYAKRKKASRLLLLMVITLVSLSGCVTGRSLGIDPPPENQINPIDSEENADDATETLREFFSALKSADLNTVNNLTYVEGETGAWKENSLLFGENATEEELDFMKKSYESLTYEINSIIEKDGLVLCDVTIKNIDLSKLDWEKYALDDAPISSVFDNADTAIVSNKFVLTLKAVDSVQKIRIDDDFRKVLQGESIVSFGG